jgi:hypothetical protein
MFEMTSFSEQEIAEAEAAFRRGSDGRLSFIGMERGEGNRLHVAAQILERGKPLWMRLVTVDGGDDLSAAVMEAGRQAAAYADRHFYESAVDERGGWSRDRALTAGANARLNGSHSSKKRPRNVRR